MNRTNKKLIAILVFLISSFGANTFAQNNKTLTDILVQKKIITQREADSINSVNAFTEKTISKNRNFTIGVEFRPRMEYRDGYRKLPNDTTSAAIFATQRSRINLDFSMPKFKFHTSIQDLRVWGQYGQSSTSGSLNVFEAYAEAYLSDDYFFRIGRQKVELDNGRLFSAANWSQAARAHDGINFIIKKQKFSSELMTFFNQTSEAYFETNFSPTTFTNYKWLSVHYFKTKINNNFTLTTLNSADGYQSKTNAKTMYVRGTSGGRIEYEKGNFYATLSGYYQYGKIQSGQNVKAYYLQPELQYKYKKLSAKLGAEIMSGDDANETSEYFKSFVPLYGVAHRFMGTMDYFINFPSDLKNGGLIDPYLFLNYDLSKKISIRSDIHLFYLQNNVKNTSGKVIDKFLAFENDLLFNYKVNNFTKIEFGVSYMSPQKSLETLSGGYSNRTPVWSYLMITFDPELFNFKN